MKKSYLTGLAAIAMGLYSCGSVKIQEYEKEIPAVVLYKNPVKKYPKGDRREYAKKFKFGLEFVFEPDSASKDTIYYEWSNKTIHKHIKEGDIVYLQGVLVEDKVREELVLRAISGIKSFSNYHFETRNLKFVKDGKTYIVPSLKPKED